QVATEGPRGTATAGQNANRSNRPGDPQGQPRAQANGTPQDGGSGGFQADGRGGNIDPEERRRRMRERLAQMTPNERAAFEQRMRERQAQAGAGNAPQGGQQQPANNPRSVKSTTASTIDSLFGPLPTVETRGRAWLYMNKELKPVNLRLGISDGTYTEVLNDTELPENVDVVTNIITPEMAAKPAAQQNNANNPLMPQRGRGPGGPGGGGRGGR